MAHRSLQLIAVGILKVDDFVYAQRRRNTGHLDGYWEFPGGKVKADETPQAAVIREVCEETGARLHGLDCRLLLIEPFEYGDRKLELHFYLIVLEQRPPVPGGAWLRVEELEESAFPPANRRALGKLKALARK